MEKILGAAIGNRPVPRIKELREIRLVPESYPDERTIGLVNRFAQSYGEDLVLYGGLTATERIYGRKRIRDMTTDLDWACTPDGLEAVLAGERVFYHEAYDILYTVVENVPVTFAFGHIHDWPVGEGFFASTRPMSPFGMPVRCCSREHSIMLKMRRIVELQARGAQPFGKDALDILNMLAAPYCRDGLEAFDVDALCALIRDNVEARPSGLAAALLFVRGYEAHLTAAECGSVSGVLDAMSAVFAA
jgi:hypothetical protein